MGKCANGSQGSLFGPYTPLQQLDILADYGTKSYIVGSTNSLLLQQKDRYSDILINLDNTTINITSSSLRAALTLSAADRRWIDFITQSVNDTWDESNPGRPSTMGYVGSEEFIRLQFEEYLLSLISAVKCHNYMKHHANNPRAMLPQVEGDPSHDFGMDWIEAWSRSENYRIWDRYTDSHLFDIVEPKHPCAGGLTIDDVQKRVMEQVKEFHLDERFAVGKEVLGRNLQAGKEKASTVFNKLYADMEALRESQRRKHEEAKREAERNGTAIPASPGFTPDMNGAKQTVQSVGSKAGAYIGSWGTWMGEKRKTGWGRSAQPPPPPPRPAKEKENSSGLHHLVHRHEKASAGDFKGPAELRPLSQESYGESIFDADAPSPPGHGRSPSSASAFAAMDLKPVDVTMKPRPHRNSNLAPHPSKFHEEMGEDDVTKPIIAPTIISVPSSPPASVAVHAEVPVPLDESAQGWNEEREKKSIARKSVGAGAVPTSEVDTEVAHARASAVAAAVEAATATPISP
jgi:hypothetical protein